MFAWLSGGPFVSNFGGMHLRGAVGRDFIPMVSTWFVYSTPDQEGDIQAHRGTSTPC